MTIFTFLQLSPKCPLQIFLPFFHFFPSTFLSFIFTPTTQSPSHHVSLVSFNLEHSPTLCLFIYFFFVFQNIDIFEGSKTFALHYVPQYEFVCLFPHNQIWIRYGKNFTQVMLITQAIVSHWEEQDVSQSSPLLLIARFTGYGGTCQIDPM